MIIVESKHISDEELKEMEMDKLSPFWGVTQGQVLVTK